MRRLGRLKYMASHTPGIMFAKLRTLGHSLTLRYFIYLLSNGLLMAAVCLGLYSRWLLSQEMVVLVVALMAVFVFAVCCALVYYFKLESLGWCVAHTWLGCLMGVVAFTETSVTQVCLSLLSIQSNIINCVSCGFN